MKILMNFVMYSYYMKETTLIVLNKPLVKVLFCIISVLMGILLSYIPQLFFGDNHLYHRVKKYPTDMKYILFWNDVQLQEKRRFIGFRPQEFQPGQIMFIQQKCPHINCFITYDKNLLDHQEDFDAIVFNLDVIRRLDLDQIKLGRSPEQLYIFRSMEPASKFPLCSRDYEHFFNLTWTYKLNSDIPQPFYDVYDENNTIVGPKLNVTWIELMRRNEEFALKMQAKNKSVAWVVHKCKLKSKHENFINDFRKILKLYNLTLDTIGPCGQYKCGSFEKCQKLVEKNYFFQLVFEEHISADYVTNKIVLAMAQMTMPIVYGAGDYQNFLPPGAYINAQAFDLYKLAALVDFLIKNREMYTAIFDWKNHYYLKERPKTQVCRLCEKLNERNVTAQTYTHFRPWWYRDFIDACERMRLLRIINGK